jgi:hypothetical protein
MGTWSVGLPPPQLAQIMEREDSEDEEDEERSMIMLREKASPSCSQSYHTSKLLNHAQPIGIEIGWVSSHESIILSLKLASMSHSCPYMSGQCDMTTPLYRGVWACYEKS